MRIFKRLKAASYDETAFFIVLFTFVKSDSSFNLTGTHATSASIYSARRTVNDSLYSFYIGLPGSV